MMRIIEQTRDEKIAMYMKLTKRELAEMVINVNAALELMQREQTIPSVVPHYISPNTCVVNNRG